jgi:hypothetical protein
MTKCQRCLHSPGSGAIESSPQRKLWERALQWHSPVGAEETAFLPPLWGSSVASSDPMACAMG